MRVIRARAHKEEERVLRLDRRPAWVSLLIDDATGRQIGIRFKWLDGPWACSPDEHFTEDGRSFRRVSSSLEISDLAMEKEIGEIETDPKKLDCLAGLQLAYLESLEPPLLAA